MPIKLSTIIITILFLYLLKFPLDYFLHHQESNSLPDRQHSYRYSHP